MGDPLRDRRSLEELAASEQVIEISAELGDFERLAAIVEADFAGLEPDMIPPGWRETAVTGRLSFARGGEHSHAVMLGGSLETALPARCQRCLRPFRLSLRTELDYELVGSDEQATGAPATDTGSDAWEVEGGQVTPLDVVDEALVMAIPLATAHDDEADCVEFDAAGDERTTTTPFADLRSRMESAKD